MAVVLGPWLRVDAGSDAGAGAGAASRSSFSPFVGMTEFVVEARKGQTSYDGTGQAPKLKNRSAKQLWSCSNSEPSKARLMSDRESGQ